MQPSMITFWQRGNRWRIVSAPILYCTVILIWRTLFSTDPADALGTQCTLLEKATARSEVQVFFATMFLVAMLEVTYPSQINGVERPYNGLERVMYGVVHAFAWTSFGLGIAKLFFLIVCRP